MANFFRFADSVAGRVETLDSGPGHAARERIIHFGGIFKVMKTGFEQIFLGARVAAGGFAFDQLLRRLRGHAKVKDEIFARKAVDAIFEVLDPFQECGAPLRRNAGGLVSEVGADVTVHKNNLAVVESGLEFRFGFEAVASVEMAVK